MTELPYLPNLPNLPNLPSELLLCEVTKWLTDIECVLLDVALNNYSKTKPQWLKKYPIGMTNKDVIDLSDVMLCVIIRCGLVNTSELSWQLAEKGKITMLQWYVVNKLPIHRSAISYAVQAGKVDCLKFLLDNRLFNVDMVGYAISSGQLDCLRLLYEHKFTVDSVRCDEQYVNRGLQRGYWNCIEFLCENSPKYLRSYLYINAASVLSIPEEQYPLAMKLFIIMKGTYGANFILDNTSVLKYILLHGRNHISKDIANVAVANAKVASLKMLLANGYKVTQVPLDIYIGSVYILMCPFLIERGIIIPDPSAGYKGYYNPVLVL